MSSVFASPGTPRSRQCPPASRQVSTSRRTPDCPMITRASSPLRRETSSVAASNDGSGDLREAVVDGEFTRVRSLIDSARMTLIVFDLDGTLIDSRRDLAESTNEMLESYGAAARPLDEVAGLVGEGAKVLVERALAAA